MQYSSTFENYSSSSKDSPGKSKGKDGKGYHYKKSTYQYDTGNQTYSGNNNSYKTSQTDQNIDQLDALLEDLKNERQITRDKDLLASPALTRKIESEPYGKVTKSSRIVKTSHKSGNVPIDIDDYATSDYSTLKSEGTLRSNIHREETEHRKVFEESLPPRSTYESKIYESNRTVNNLGVVPPSTAVTKTDIETDLKNIALTDDILPLPGTKVTTTVRTYTYEIPAGTSPNTSTLNSSQNILYKNYQHNEFNSLSEPQPHPVQHIPPTVVYNKESYSSINRGTERPIVSNQSYEIHEKKETNTIRNNEYVPPRPEGPGKSEMVFRVKTTENVRTISEPQPSYPITNTSYTSTEYNSPQTNYPAIPPGPTTNKYFYKETQNIVNTVHGPNGPEPRPHYKPPAELPPNYPPNVSNVTYKYTSSTTKNTQRDYSPNTNLPPAPFPIDGSDYPMTNGNPPQRVDDLMQSFGTTDAVDKTEVETIHRKREIETAVASPNQQVPSVNRPGKEVYYPPGHDTMLQKREEMAAASAGGGRWAKGSGMHEYESGYKSKSKTKSGGAMVPVCLPLCCAMPCSIM